MTGWRGGSLPTTKAHGTVVTVPYSFHQFKKHPSRPIPHPSSPGGPTAWLRRSTGRWFLRR